MANEIRELTNNDQIPRWLRLNPNTVVYVEFETRKGTQVRNLGSLNGFRQSKST